MSSIRSSYKTRVTDDKQGSGENATNKNKSTDSDAEEQAENKTNDANA